MTVSSCCRAANKSLSLMITPRFLVVLLPAKHKHSWRNSGFRSGVHDLSQCMTGPDFDVGVGVQISQSIVLVQAIDDTGILRRLLTF